MTAPPLVLASASPRRRELLATICPDFRVEPSDIEEPLDTAEPGAIAALALAKARAVVDRGARGLVLAADTVVVLDGVPLGKPSSADDARAMLRRLRGREHVVITGVALIDTETGRAASRAVVTRVVMADYPEAAIDDYVATGEPLDKAGAYAVQGLGGRLVAEVRGCYTNVVGLPVTTTRQLLSAFGVPVRDAESSEA